MNPRSRRRPLVLATRALLASLVLLSGCNGAGPSGAQGDAGLVQPPPPGSGGVDAAPPGSGGVDAAPPGSGGVDAAPPGSGGVDATPPGSGGVTSITTTCSGAISTVGTECTFHVNFGGPVVVGGSWHPRLNLATSPVPAIAYYCGGSGTSTLDFCYTLWGGQAEATVSTSSSAINLNGATIESTSGVDATLAGANSVSISGLSFSPGGAYCVSPGGNDGSSGICGSASFATLTKCQAAMQGSSVKTCFLQAGTYTGLSTCNFNTNTGVSATAYVCRTSSDDGEVWAAFPGETAVLDGQATAWNNGVFVPFESNGTSNNTIQGLTMQHFAGGGPYEYQPVNLTIEDNIIQDMYNNGGTNGEYEGQGTGGCTYVLNWWSNVNVSHNTCQNLAGYGISTNSGEQGTNGYTMSLTYDDNLVSNVCTDASDCGGIYTGWYPWGNTLGLGPDLVHVTNNVINNVGGANTAGACIYLDIQSSGVTATGNVCTGVYTWGVEYDLGTNNALSNNVFDISALAPTWSNNGSQNNTVWFDTFVECGNQGCVQQGPVTYDGNIIYNGNESSSPPDYMGVYYGGASSYVTQPTMGTNWYWTTTGSFSNSPYCWANTTLGSGNSGVCNSSGVTEDPLFVDASASTPAGYQLQASSPVLAAGFTQIVQTQGPR